MGQDVLNRPILGYLFDLEIAAKESPLVYSRGSKKIIEGLFRKVHQNPSFENIAEIRKTLVDNFVETFNLEKSKKIKKDKMKKEKQRNRLCQHDCWTINNEIAKEKTKLTNLIDIVYLSITLRVSITPKIAEIIHPYRFLAYDRVAKTTRLGTYNTIHYLRAFAHSIAISNLNSYQLSGYLPKERLYQAYQKVLDSPDAASSYSGWLFPSLCDPAGLTSVYIPIAETHNAEIGSSWQLFRELEILDKNGSMQFIKDIAESKTSSIEGIDGFEITEWARTLAQSILWAWKKLMFHAVESLIAPSVITFY